MIVFAIPLRAKETSPNWIGCVERLNHTVASIFNQTNPNFKCIIACNQKPELDPTYDERLEFIELSMPVPSRWIEMARDKFWKLTMIAVRIREILDASEDPDAGIYVMPVDGDDLLNCHIAEYCEKYPDENGLVSRDGYVWHGASRYFEIYPQMHTYCGSCNIIKMYKEDLPECSPTSPELCHDGPTAGMLNERYPIRYDHNTVVERYEEMGRPFSYLPFRSTVYVLDTGENISSEYQREQGVSEHKRIHFIVAVRKLNIFKYRLITNRIRTEFKIKENEVSIECKMEAI